MVLRRAVALLAATPRSLVAHYVEGTRGRDAGRVETDTDLRRMSNGT